MGQEEDEKEEEEEGEEVSDVHDGTEWREEGRSGVFLLYFIYPYERK